MRVVNESVRVKAQVVHWRQARHGRSSKCPRDDRQFTRIGPETPQSLRSATFPIQPSLPLRSATPCLLRQTRGSAYPIT